AQVGQAARLEADLVEADLAAVAGRRLRLEPDRRIDALSEREMADELPLAAVRRGVERERLPRAGDAQPDVGAIDDEAVRVVRGSPRHDRDDHRLASGRVLEAELRPRPFAVVEH